MGHNQPVWQTREGRKQILTTLVREALRAVDPREAVRRAVRREGASLLIGGKRYDLGRYRRVMVIGGGKAGAAMAQGIEDVLGDRVSGVVAVKHGYTAPTNRIAVLEAAHPVPDESSLRAGQEIARLAGKATSDDLVFFLLSGGASAILTLPAADITLDDKRRVTDALLRAGATIDELNAVRKHLSSIKGGGIARLAAPATLVTLVLSDVVGSPLDVIGSGPTVGDASTFQQAYGVLERNGLLPSAPEAVARRLRAGMAGAVPETLKPGGPLLAATSTMIVGSNEMAAEAAVRAAEATGFHALLLSTYVEGEAREVAKVLAGIAKEMKHSGRPLRPPGCVVAGGETTVTVRGSGLGGRNQELALAAAIQLAGIDGVAVASLATDGTDGPTGAAGAYVDGESAMMARAAGLDLAAALASNDSYTALSALKDLIVTGPTNTNVNDLIFVLAFP